MKENNANNIKEETLYAPLNEDSNFNSFYIEAKNNINQSKRWAYIIGIIGMIICFLGISGIGMRYIFMRYEFDQAKLYQWILGFIFDFNIILLGMIALLSGITSKFPTLRLYISIFVL